MKDNMKKKYAGCGKTSINLVLATVLFLLACCLIPPSLLADVPQGNPLSATNYYVVLSKTLSFSTPENIFQTKLDDVASYLGYGGFTGADLQNIPSEFLMRPEQLLSLTNPPDTSPNSFQHPEIILASLGAIPIQPNDILVTRFFAPKIMNINEPEQIRPLGWRKLVRLRARPGSVAEKNHIAYGIILFNFFTQPGAKPFAPTDESVNTQVMLVPESSSVAGSNGTGLDALYWLDYDTLSKGGALSIALNASFDASELPQTNNGVRPYFVPDGCVACHGNNRRASLVNYLDTDHWFDRLDTTDFTSIKTNDIPLLVDAQTNDTNALSFKLAFDAIRRFNTEADIQVGQTQRNHDEALASHKWLEVHAINNGHVLPLDRAIGIEPRWSSQNPTDEKTLSAFNQYCFRCHGTVKFSVFNKQAIRQPQRLAMIEQMIKTNAPVGIKMPPDRELPDDVRSVLTEFINQ